MAKGNLLIIDDEQMILSSLKELLEDVADKIFVADNGLEGLKILESEQVHTIVCDINMPQMTGLEVIKEVRSRNIEIPFIFYTGYGSRELMMEAVKFGAFDFLEKPNMDGLEQIVTSALKVGLNSNNRDLDHEVLITEYQKMIRNIKN